MRSTSLAYLLAIVVLVGNRSTWADEPPQADPFASPGPNQADEPLAEQFSLDATTRFLDSAAVSWQNERKCMTCHTNYAYLLARPAIGSDGPAPALVRTFAEQLITDRWPKSGPRWDAEVVMTGVMLALNDRVTTGKLHPLTRQALDRMWTVQKEDGGFDWLKCEWPPMESDDHFGATMAVIGAGAAPEEYAQTEAAVAGLGRLREYLQKNPGPTLHHRLMVVWAASEHDGVLSPEEQNAVIEKVWPLQHDDGGWGLAQLGDWQREDGSPQDTATSDGYGTAFVVWVARRAGVSADDPRLVRATDWLLTHQRQSGRWFTRSVHADGKHFITHAGTAMAVLALDACGRLPKPAPTANASALIEQAR